MVQDIIIDFPPAADASPEDLAALQKHDESLKRNLARITMRMHKHYEWVRYHAIESLPCFSLQCKATKTVILCKSAKDLAAISPEDLIYVIECVWTLPSSGSLG